MKFSFALVLLAIMANKGECSSKGTKSPKSPKSSKSSKSEFPSATPSISLSPSQSSSPSSIPSDSPSSVPSTIPSDSPSTYPSTTVEPSFEPSDMPSEYPSVSSAPSKSGKASKASQKSPTVPKAPKSPKSVKSVDLAFNVGNSIRYVQDGGGNTIVLGVSSFSWQQYGKYIKEGDYYLTIDDYGNLAFAIAEVPTEWKIKDEKIKDDDECKMLYTQPRGGLRTVVCAENSDALILVEWEYRENDSPNVPVGGNCCLEDGITDII